MKNKYDRKFEKQVNHMSSFIGMPQWNDQKPTRSEIRENDRRLIERQVERQARGFKPKKLSILDRSYRWIGMVLANGVKQIVIVSEKSNEKKEPVNTGSECCS